MKTILIFALSIMSLSNCVNAQILMDIPDQYTESNIYDTINIEDFIMGVDCYDVSILPNVSHLKPVVGHPNILDTWYQDTRENMTVTMKINYAGFNMGIHPSDEIWVYDSEDRLVEKNVAYDDPFHPGEHLFFLNVRGNFETYNARVVYYNGTYNYTMEFENAIEYDYNNVLGSPLDPYLLDSSPIIFSINNNTISAEIVSDNYGGSLCLDVEVADCDGQNIGTDQICYLLGSNPCPDNLLITQEMLDQVVQNTLVARHSISSHAIVDDERDLQFSAGDCTTLMPGFEVVLGGQLLVDTVGCP